MALFILGFEFDNSEPQIGKVFKLLLKLFQVHVFDHFGPDSLQGIWLRIRGLQVRVLYGEGHLALHRMGTGS